MDNSPLPLLLLFLLSERGEVDGVQRGGDKEEKNKVTSSSYFSFMSIEEEDKVILLLPFLSCGDGGRDIMFLFSFSSSFLVIKEEKLILFLLLLGDQGGRGVLRSLELARVLSMEPHPLCLCPLWFFFSSSFKEKEIFFPSSFEEKEILFPSKEGPSSPPLSLLL